MSDLTDSKRREVIANIRRVAQLVRWLAVRHVFPR